MAVPSPTPARAKPRLRLDSVDRVRREIVKLYREGKDGTRPAGDVQQLAATLAIVGQLIEAQP